MDSLITIEGNIGCGKTALLNELEQALLNFDCGNVLPFRCIDEDVESWRNVEGIDVLRRFYQNPTAWGLSLQTIITTSNHHRLCDALNKKGGVSNFPMLLISGRGIQSTSKVFVPVLYEQKYISDKDAAIIRFIIDKIPEKIKNSHLYIYLRTTPETCLQRLREREETDNIDLAYLNLIHAKHEEWFKATTTHQEENVVKFNPEINAYGAYIDGSNDVRAVSDNVIKVLEDYVKNVVMVNLERLDGEVAQMKPSKHNSTLYSTFLNLLEGNVDSIPEELLLAIENIKTDLSEDPAAQGAVSKNIFDCMARRREKKKPKNSTS